LTELELERACPIFRGSNKATKSVGKDGRCASLEDNVTLSLKLPMIY
jgi:hypothetical protein